MRPATIFLRQRRRGDGLARAKEGSREESAQASAFFFEKITDRIEKLTPILKLNKNSPIGSVYLSAIFSKYSPSE